MSTRLDLFSRHRLLAALLLLLSWLGISALPVPAQSPASVVMLSDIHLDPFRDPAQLPRLRSETIEHWPAILSAAPSATQAADLAALQEACPVRAPDSAWPLMHQALVAAHDAQPRPAFVAMPGDLLTHEFGCRFRHLAAGATEDDTAAFAAKTVAFELQQIRQTFPHIPLFAVPGNNDSPCGDYRETPGEPFLTAASASIAAAAGVPASEVTPEGDYTVTLPAPFGHARLLVLQDIFAARTFTTCSGTASRDPQKAQIDWLRAQLAQARARHEQVWVMTHMPPGIDVYTSFHSYVFRPAAMCSAEPRPFLADSSLADALLDYADVVRLLLLGHTHLDEIRLLRRPAGEGQPAAVIPAKVVPSVSPILGNHPSFLVASVDPRTLILKDWRLFVSPGSAGSTPPWTESYRYTTAYRQVDFSAKSAALLADQFTADPTGQNTASSTYRAHFYPGDVGLYSVGVAQIWPAYACSVREFKPSAVQKCICDAAAHPSPPAQGTPGQ